MPDPDPKSISPVTEEIQLPAHSWRALIGWISFVLQIFIQILRLRPSSFSLHLPFLGLPNSLLSSSAPFEPLPAEISIEVSALEELEKLTIVLDLDETLVCSYEASSLPDIVKIQAIAAGFKCFDLECKTLGKKELEGRENVNHVVVFERPGLEEFLEQTSKFADLVLFTAGLEGYARPLLDVIDIKNRFSLRLYRPSTVTTQYRHYVKDLSCLSKDLSRVVIVDNNPFSFLLQPLNGIPCVTFAADQPFDEELPDTGTDPIHCHAKEVGDSPKLLNSGCSG